MTAGSYATTSASWQNLGKEPSPAPRLFPSLSPLGHLLNSGLPLSTFHHLHFFISSYLAFDFFDFCVTATRHSFPSPGDAKVQSIFHPHYRIVSRVELVLLSRLLYLSLCCTSSIRTLHPGTRAHPELGPWGRLGLHHRVANPSESLVATQFIS